jgi:hypothetical protein
MAPIFLEEKKNGKKEKKYSPPKVFIYKDIV